MTAHIDPRVARTHNTVMSTAIDLLVEGGPDALTVDAVVARSGVAKTTVYRHWESRDALVLDVFRSCAPKFDAPPSGHGFVESIEFLVDQIGATLTDSHWQHLFPELLRLKAQHPEFAELHDRLDDEQTDVLDEVIARGVQEGLLPHHMADNMPATASLLIGPLVLASMVSPETMTPEFRARTVRQFIAAAAAELATESEAADSE